MRAATEPLIRRWLGFELNILRRLKFSTIAIPFAGSPDLDWYLKFWGKQVYSNDICKWAAAMSRAYVENRNILLSEEDVAMLMNEAAAPHGQPGYQLIDDRLSEADAIWLSNLRPAIGKLHTPYRQALAVSHALRVGEYALSFQPHTSHLRRPLSDVFLQFWRSQRQVFDNGKDNRSFNLDASYFLRQVSADVMFARFPGPRGLLSRHPWREILANGNPEEWKYMLRRQRGRLGDAVLSKQHYQELIATFLVEARRVGRWAISHTDDGFMTLAEMTDIIRRFRKIDTIYHKDFSEVIGGHNTYLLITR
jgi:hypothetical protein